MNNVHSFRMLIRIVFVGLLLATGAFAGLSKKAPVIVITTTNMMAEVKTVVSITDSNGRFTSLTRSKATREGWDDLYAEEQTSLSLEDFEEIATICKQILASRRIGTTGSDCSPLHLTYGDQQRSVGCIPESQSLIKAMKGALSQRASKLIEARANLRDRLLDAFSEGLDPDEGPLFRQFHR